MAKFEKIKDVTEAVFFDKSVNPSQWPAKVQANIKSVTGYSYGTLDDLTSAMGYPYKDGFQLEDLNWIVTENGVSFPMTDTEFKKVYSPKDKAAEDELLKGKQAEPILRTMASPAVASSKTVSTAAKKTTKKKTK
jgi:hypothetical protein